MRKILFMIVNKILKLFKGKGLSKTKVGKFVYEKIFIPLKPPFVEIKNERFRLYIHKGGDILSDRLLISKEYKPVETKVIKEIVKEEDVVVDAGANIGYYTILLSRIVKDKGKVYAFEPNKECFYLLKKNVKYNKCNNVVLINKALSDNKGKIKFYINKKDKASSSTLPFNKQNLNSSQKETKDSYAEVIVECTTLDKEIGEPIDFMKMDIEGSELNGLIGAKTLLQNCKKMVIEVPESRKDSEDIKQLLGENQYEIERLDEGNILCTKQIIIIR